ncbi:MAG: hypothetical protein LUC98_04605 [Lachnospiraceae bacterium]|nr:hypothetical protein [Lachnospiraceae bacterium]
MKTDIKSEESFASAEAIRALDDEEMASVSGGSDSWTFSSLRGMTGSFTMKVLKGTKMNDVWATMENTYGDYGKAVKIEVNNLVKALDLQSLSSFRYYAYRTFTITANNDRITVRVS